MIGMSVATALNVCSSHGRLGAEVREAVFDLPPTPASKAILGRGTGNQREAAVEGRAKRHVTIIVPRAAAFVFLVRRMIGRLSDTSLAEIQPRSEMRRRFAERENVYRRAAFET
jgi:hypothetical protein